MYHLPMVTTNYLPVLLTLQQVHHYHDKMLRQVSFVDIAGAFIIIGTALGDS